MVVPDSEHSCRQAELSWIPSSDDWQPVHVLQNWRYPHKLFSPCDESSGGILCRLKFVYHLITDSSKGAMWSSRLPTNVWTSVFVASVVSDCLIDLSCHNWNKQVRLSTAVWSAMVSWLSIQTPKSLTTSATFTVAFGRVSVVAVTLFSCWRVPS